MDTRRGTEEQMDTKMDTVAQRSLRQTPTPTRTYLGKRDQLMLRKIEVDECLAKAKIDIDEAKAIACSEGRFIPAREFAQMQRGLAALQRESQRLQFELRGDRKDLHTGKDKQNVRFLQDFFLAARRSLPKQEYVRLCKEAEDSMRGEVAAAASERE